ncbi:uncharacterized protein LOC129737945 [Uranotaenia lowii]|uniref:uncharacterized protein LOC129737945 n=1 Tax=Uranotaenia lowii TaxID=190385 RepID=UPI00247871B9|nr:uncharacterized protein LOC129737945 [Uranotaenia lowii]
MSCNRIANVDGNDETHHNCMMCSKPDEEQTMVACDVCSRWGHFSCVGVDSSIKDHPWTCADCSAAAKKGTSSRSSKSGMSSASRLTLRMRKLDEEKIVQMQILEEKEKVQLNNVAKKYALLAQEAAAEDGDVSVRSRRSLKSTDSKVQQWLYQNPVLQMGTAVAETTQAPSGIHAGIGTQAGTQLPAVTSTNNAVYTGTVKKNRPGMLPTTQVNPASAEALQFPAYSQFLPPNSFVPQMTSTLHQPVVTGNNYPAFPMVSYCTGAPIVSSLPTIGTKVKQPNIPAGYNQRWEPVPPPLNAVPFPVAHPITSMAHNQPMEYQPRYEHPTNNDQPAGEHDGNWNRFQRQLAARQVGYKELPVFNGNPEDWSQFISSYRNSTSVCGFSDSENLLRLQKSLKGSALDAVRSNLYEPASVPLVMSMLENLFGNPERLVQVLLQKVRSTPAPKPDRLETLINFGVAVQNLVGHMRSANLRSHLTNPSLMHELVQKLPANYRLDWSLHMRRMDKVDLEVFCDYISVLVSAANDVTFTYEAPSNRPTKPEKKDRDTAFIHTHVQPQEVRSDRFTKKEQPRPQNESKPCFVCRSTTHRIRDCLDYKALTVPDRWKLVSEHKLCHKCLIPHGKWICKSKRRCEIADCDLEHHTLLHPGQPKESSSATIAFHQQMKSSTLFRIVPVILYNGAIKLHTFAFLDDGSSTTLLEQSVADQLGIDGVHLPLCMIWTANVTRSEKSSRKVNLEISGLRSEKRVPLQGVRTVEKLDLPVQSLCYDYLVRRYPYLEKLPVDSYQDAIPKILIGLDNFKAAVPVNRREGQAHEPVALKSRIGWTICGNVSGSSKCSQELKVSPSLHIAECPENKNEPILHDLVKGFFAVERLGISATPVAQSGNDRRAVDILNRTTRLREDGHYETGLLWRYEKFNFPPSRGMAERRNQCLQRKLSKDPELRLKVNKQIQDYLAKGYAHKASDQELNESDPYRTWYLPISVVTNPKKPGKLRIVWDAAAKSGNVCLNDMLLKGPDMLTALPTVLYRFRQRQVCVTGDIREMYHQVKIRREDQQAQRFLWSEEPNSLPEVYVMDVATFGATCSPCSAQHVKNSNAKRWEEQYPDAVEAIIEGHYVDDYADSRDTLEEVVELTQTVRMIHSSAGMELRNFLSNSSQVLSQLGQECVTEPKQFSDNTVYQSERVLGMTWYPDSDQFGYRVLLRDDLQQLIAGKVVLSKRMILKFVMSLFDPLGLLAHFLIQAKVLIQALWRNSVGWDDPVPPEIESLWTRWLDVFREMDVVRIPRCYFPNYAKDSYQTLQMHVFVDAGENAYSAVAYFRIVDCGQPRCVLVSSKARVAPLKPLSMPRLELEAAVIGSRLSKSIAQGHSIPIKQKFFWSDSSTVLSWIKSDAMKYRPYVAFRVGEIQELTNVDEWRWVPTKENVADEATKWGKGPCLKSDSRWFIGPEFLYLAEAEWPQKVVKPVEIVEELRPVHAHREVEDQLYDLGKFSKWERLLRTVSFMFSWRNHVRKTGQVEKSTTVGELSQIDFQCAERALWRLAQSEAYPDEIIILKKLKSDPKNLSCKLGKTSPLRKLSPFVDETGIVRMQSRTEYSPFAAFDAKYPIILPKGHRVTELLVDWYHRKYAHSYGETVVNELRQKFYISELRAVVRRVAKGCCWCKVYKAKQEAPRMAPLPEERVTPGGRPFSIVGIDYFGPYSIKIGRSNVKRWVALFTCLVVRAVHLEAVTSLSTEACKLAIRRFIARRGPPLKVFSDNGTNFVGASRELRNEIKMLNEGLASTFTNAETEWFFNPPSSPHMGGAWERMVRTVKVAMNALHESRSPTDEVFVTVLCEAESIVNSRPLTHLPLETADQESLTPNHFLLLDSHGAKQSEKRPTSEREALTSGWNQCQKLLDTFWQRWVKEYLPTLNRRTKWYDDVKPIVPGDLVFIADDGIRNRWIRGKVVRTVPGKDGRTRQAYVQTGNMGILKRPVAKLAIVDVRESGKAADPEHLYGAEDVATD